MRDQPNPPAAAALAWISGRAGHKVPALHSASQPEEDFSLIFFSEPAHRREKQHKTEKEDR